MLVLVSVSHGPADYERARGDSIASNEPRGLPLLHLRVEERCRTVPQASLRQRGTSFFLEFPAAVKELRKTDLVKGRAADRMHGARAEGWCEMLSSRSGTGGEFLLIVKGKGATVR
jgi:hypothetical protein